MAACKRKNTQCCKQVLFCYIVTEWLDRINILNLTLSVADHNMHTIVLG